LDVGDERQLPISVMKLLKVLYFAYGWYLASRGCRLFHNPIQAWDHGPVVRCVWEEFEGQRTAITTRAMVLDLASGCRTLATTDLDAIDIEFIRAISLEHLHEGAWALSERTHEADTPWSAVWHSSGQSANLGMRIADDMIREYFARYPGRAISS
jgi:uncharacterized phage-associated protein